MENTQGNKIDMTLSCPMPKMDFDTITLGHGSGGLLTNKLLESGVFNILQNEYLDQKHDGAIVELNGRTAFSTDSFVISPIFFPGGNIGEIAVNGTVNDLAMCGAIPKYLSLSFIIEEGMKMEDFWKVIVGVRQACHEAGVSIITGDTKVVEKGKGDQIFINTSGIGSVMENAQISIKNIQPGDKIIVSGNIASHGMAIMSVRDGLEFESTIESDTRPLHVPIQNIIEKYGNAIKLLKDPTRGGLGTVLTEVARDSVHGIEIYQNKLPIDAQVSAACEILGFDPIYVANEGIFIAIVDGDESESIVADLKEMKYCEDACIIGEVCNDHPKKVILHSAIGGKRVVNMLVGEQLPRIC